jgi:hypothetical protein
VKSLVTITIMLLVAALTGTAQGHPDTLGTPDPYWQNIASASGDGRAQIAADGTTAIAGAGATHPGLLRGYVYGVGAVFVILALSLLHSLWISSRRSGS